MKRKKLPLLEKIEVTDIGSRGKAIARVDNFVTFVSNALPGDVVDIQLQKRKKAGGPGIRGGRGGIASNHHCLQLG